MNGKEVLIFWEFLWIVDFFVINGYRLGFKIGEGIYFKVRIVEWFNNGEFLVVKIIDKRIGKKSYVIKFLLRELEIVVFVKYLNVICMYEILY